MKFWHTFSKTFSSVQFEMVSVRSGKLICTPPSLSGVPQCCLWNSSNVGPIDDGLSASSFYASLFQAIDGVMPLALCPQVVSHAPLHFRSSKAQATCHGCFPASLSALSFPLDSSMSRTAHLPDSSKVVVEHWHMPARAWLPIPLIVAGSLSLWEWWHVCSDCHLLRQSNEDNICDCFHCQAGGWDFIGCTVFVDGVAPCLTVKPHPDWPLVTEPSV